MAKLVIILNETRQTLQIIIIKLVIKMFLFYNSNIIRPNATHLQFVVLYCSKLFVVSDDMLFSVHYFIITIVNRWGSSLQ